VIVIGRKARLATYPIETNSTSSAVSLYILSFMNESKIYEPSRNYTKIDYDVNNYNITYYSTSIRRHVLFCIISWVIKQMLYTTLLA